MNKSTKRYVKWGMRIVMVVMVVLTMAMVCFTTYQLTSAFYEGKEEIHVNRCSCGEKSEESKPQEYKTDLVFVTEKDKKCHKPTCNNIQGFDTQYYMTEQEEIEDGYSACDKCYK